MSVPQYRHRKAESWCWVFGVGSCLVFLAVVVNYTFQKVRRNEEREAARAAEVAREDAEVKSRMESSERAWLKRRDEAWLRCKADGDRPVMAGFTVVCIKQEAVAWEQEITHVQDAF